MRKGQLRPDQGWFDLFGMWFLIMVGLSALGLIAVVIGNASFVAWLKLAGLLCGTPLIYGWIATGFLPPWKWL